MTDLFTLVNGKKLEGTPFLNDITRLA